MVSKWVISPTYKWGMNWGYNPLANHLLTSWDIQVSFKYTGHIECLGILLGQYWKIKPLFTKKPAKWICFCPSQKWIDSFTSKSNQQKPLKIWPNGIIFHLSLDFPEIRGPISLTKPPLGAGKRSCEVAMLAGFFYARLRHNPPAHARWWPCDLPGGESGDPNHYFWKHQNFPRTVQTPHSLAWICLFDAWKKVMPNIFSQIVVCLAMLRWWPFWDGEDVKWPFLGWLLVTSNDRG